LGINDPVSPQFKSPNEIVEEIRKPSKGDELIKRLQESISIVDVCTNELTDKVSPDVSKKPGKDYIGEIINGVEVIDVKALDKLGIPIEKDRKTWDKI
jgi:hypothetical protein